MPVFVVNQSSGSVVTTSTLYMVGTASAEYSVGDLVRRLDITDLVSSTVTTSWTNLTTGLPITNPLVADFYIQSNAALTDGELRAAPVPISGSVQILGGNINPVVTDSSATTQPISALELPLPLYAATEEAQLAGNTFLQNLDVKIPSLGEAAKAASLPVVLPTDGDHAKEATVASIKTATESINAKLPAIGQRAAVDSVSVVLASDQSLPLPTGAASDASLQSILSAIKATVNITGSVWVDNTAEPAVYYIRRESVNEGTAEVTISWYTIDGIAATPNTANLSQAARQANVVNESTVYTATAAGSGYATGDVLINSFGVNPTAGTVAYTLWLNATTDTVLSSAPTAGTFAGAAAQLPAGAATSALQTAGNSTLETLAAKLPAALGELPASESLSVVVANQPAGGNVVLGAFSLVVAIVADPSNQWAIGDILLRFNRRDGDTGTWYAEWLNVTDNALVSTAPQASDYVPFEAQTLDYLKTLTLNLPAQGQADKASSLPVTLASDQGNLNVAIQGAQRTPSLTNVVMANATIAAGAVSASFYNSGTASALVAGGALAPGMGCTFDAPAGDTLGAIEYDCSFPGSALMITTIV